MSECEPDGVALAEEEYTYRADDDQTLSEAVIQAVTAAVGVEMIPTNANRSELALDPLYNTIDPDALDSLFQATEDGEPMPGAVEFLYCGYEVTVQSSGLVKVTSR